MKKIFCKFFYDVKREPIMMFRGSTSEYQAERQPVSTLNGVINSYVVARFFSHDTSGKSHERPLKVM